MSCTGIEIQDFTLANDLALNCKMYQVCGCSLRKTGCKGVN